MSNFYKRWADSFTTLDAIILFLLSATIFFVVFNFNYLPIHSHFDGNVEFIQDSEFERDFKSNADVLFIEDIARDLNAGGSTFDWRLTQAPYLFPDIFIARLLVYITPDIGQVAPVYACIFGIMMVALVFWLCRVCKINPTIPVFTSAFLYLLMYFGPLSGDVLSVYFGMIGHHSGISLCIILALIGTILLEKSDFNSQAAQLLILFSLFLGVISDSLVAVALVPPLFAYYSLLLYNKEITFQKAFQLLASLILVTFLAKAFGFTNPFPQDREFIEQFIRLFPKLTITSLKIFLHHFYSYVTTSPITGLLVILYLYSFFLASKQVRSCFSSKSHTKSAETLLSLFIIISPLLVILLQIALGIYIKIDSCRQWAPLIYLSIIFGAILIEKEHREKLETVKSIFIVVVALNLILATYQLSNNRTLLPKHNEILPLLACMNENHLPEGALYIADYWLTRPIRMYSQDAYGVVTYYDGPSGGKPIPFTNASNIKQTRTSNPGYVITGFAIKEENILKNFGKPSAEYCNLTVYGTDVKVLNYSDNIEAKKYFKEQAMKSY